MVAPGKKATIPNPAKKVPAGGPAKQNPGTGSAQWSKGSEGGRWGAALKGTTPRGPQRMRNSNPSAGVPSKGRIPGSGGSRETASPADSSVDVV